MNRSAFAALAVVWSLTACGPRPPDGPRQSAVVPESLVTLARDYNSAWELLNPDSILTFHAPRFEYYWFDQRFVEDFEPVLRQEWLAGVRSYSIEMFDASVRVLGSDGAVVSFLFRDSEVSSAGDTIQGSGALTYVMERFDGIWKISRVHHSGPVPEKLY